MRWNTTAQAAQDETARVKAEEIADARSKGLEPVDRKAQLRAMKVGLQRTSISFGQESVSYISDNVEKQRQVLVGFSVQEREAQKKRTKEMKATLTQTNFMLGDEVPEYLSVNTEAMALTKDAAKKQDKTADKAAAEALKAAIKRSSLHFGNEERTKDNMKSVAHEGMENILGGNTNDFAKLKRETQELTTALRRHNFSFGEEKNEYLSDSHRGYQNYGKEHYRQIIDGQEKSKAIIADTRSAHFNFGLDKIEYISDTHRAMKSVARTAENIETDRLTRENARKMKIALTRTSINLGDDEEYI